MSNLQVIENKISYIKKHLTVVGEFRKNKLADIQQNAILRAAIERELYKIAQAVIDLAEAFIAHKKFRKPTTMSEAIDILGEEHILPLEFVEKFRKIVGFRNALAHDYEDLRIDVVYNVLQEKMPEVEEFLSFIKKAL